MSDQEYDLQISDIAGFSNYPTWWAYRQKARIMAVVMWALIIYIFILWISRSIINYNQYKESSHYLLLIDAVLVFAYTWLVMPYHNMSQNKFTGIKEMQRQLAQQEIENEMNEEDMEEQQSIDAKKCSCNYADDRHDKLIKMLKDEISQKNIQIEQLIKTNEELSKSS